MRYVALFIWVFWGIPTLAQVAPNVTVQVPDDATTVGQPAIIRVKVLVPTFMPSPPVFPSLERENLLVRLPERASGPVSEAIEGETWSGVQRSYRVYPLTAGNFDLGAQQVVVTYADPDTNAPIQTTVDLPRITFEATVPDAARGLDPLIIATGFDVTQEIDGERTLKSGDAITRRLTARISGTTPMLIPQLMPDLQGTLLRSYPKEPKLTETEDRGVLSGERVDEVTYLAQNGGDTQLPAVSIQWFNLTSNAVETIEIDAIDLTLVPPKAPPPDAADIARYLGWIAILAGIFWTVYRFGKPRLNTWKSRRRQTYLASPKHALDQIKAGLQAHDLKTVYTGLEEWKSKADWPADSAELEAALTQIGAAIYAQKKPNKADWNAAGLALVRMRHSSEKAHTAALPPLNP
ncbi:MULTISPECIES: BatD family protein [unclassified Ruegeria]|uniref:BatD family protein n=1 Tax=unclassified Ruegeria TaxID=2625375 RepID=UPI0014895F61|nr:MULTISPECIES: BatD family protein [unclassified Ruegeria]